MWKYQAGPWESEDPVESWETESAEKPQMDLVTEATHLPGDGDGHIHGDSIFDLYGGNVSKATDVFAW